MTSRRVAIALWLALTFVAWNVVFDRKVADAAVGFTREQIVRSQQGVATRSIDDAFRPQVRAAALVASGWAALVLACGIAVLRVSAPRRGSGHAPE